MLSSAPTMPHIPLLCLSSSRTPRYRLDVLRALALPIHAALQYRYSADIVDSSLQQQLKQNALKGSEVLLAHVDLATERTDGPAHVTPVRKAVLQESQQLGNYFILRFQLWGYAVVDDIASFQKTLPVNGPHWEGHELKGLWCLAVQEHRGWAAKSHLDAFQEVTRALCVVKEFREQPFFIGVEGIFARNSDARIKATEEGDFVVGSGSDFEMRIFHFHPDHDHVQWQQKIATIELDATEPLISTVMNQKLAVDSPYDLKRILFKAGEVAGLAKFGTIVVRVVDDTKKELDPDPKQPELVVPLKIEPAWARTVFQIAGLSLLLFLQQYVSASATRNIGVVRAAVLVVLAIATAAVAVFAIKPPPK